MVGFGSVGQGVLPLLLRHIEMKPEQIFIITADDKGIEIARKYNVPHTIAPLTSNNYLQALEPHLLPGNFLLNLSVDVCSFALIEVCQKRGVLYLDSCIEPWIGGYTNTSLPAPERSDYALREQALALRKPGKNPTAVLTHGANPGLVSHFLKQALLNIAVDTGESVDAPKTRDGWARLAQALGIRTIHIAERDTQIANDRKKQNEFLNTWSVDGFISESCQPAELGWGSHERHFPTDAKRYDFGVKSAIYLTRPGGSTRVRTWLPLAGETHGFLITHNEAISIADYFTVGAGHTPEYRPTVHYAYHPCDDAVLSLHELAGRNWQAQTNRRVLKEEIISGMDELGVLVMGHARNSYWYGSRLSTPEARELCPHNSATTLQITSSVMAGVIWAMRNPTCGIVEPDEIPYDEVLRLCHPYLGKVVGVYSDWTPLKDRNFLFEEDIDREDPWQFKNFRVT
ncbi:MAG: saccharopine dehydrogenase C-terminal domain-containing protein [Pseudomonadota bacterium]